MTLLAAVLGPITAFITAPVRNAARPSSLRPSCLGLERRNGLHTNSKDLVNGSSRRIGTAMAAAAREVTGEELEVEMTEWEQPMILDVFATWCGPCVQLKPEIEKLSQALEGKCRVLKLDSDEEEDMAGTLNIYGLPTVIFMKDGEVRHRTEGFLPAEEMLQLADIHLFGKAPPEVTDPADDLFIDDSPAASACAPPADNPACQPPSKSSACEP
eukprot:g8115.t1